LKKASGKVSAKVSRVRENLLGHEDAACRREDSLGCFGSDDLVEIGDITRILIFLDEECSTALAN
jgi:hypothetical protein